MTEYGLMNVIQMSFLTHNKVVICSSNPYLIQCEEGMRGKKTVKMLKRLGTSLNCYAFSVVLIVETF